MVAVQEDCPQPTTPRRKLKDEGKSCYSVKIHVTKCPEVFKQTSEVCQQEESSCAPVLPPPVKNPPDWDYEFRRTRENFCQTDQCHRRHQACDPIEVQLKSSCETGAQCCGISSLTSDSYCQTVHAEMKHFGLQTLALERNAKHCQTDLEQHCDVVGVSHDRNSCRKTCCVKEGSQKRDVKHQASGPEPCCKGPSQNGGACKCSHKARVSCESKKSEFPFLGRTPSGNFKVSPLQVSFVNTEFGILAANPQSARITVRRLQSCESSLAPKNLGKCPQQIPVNRRNVCSRKPCCVLKQSFKKNPAMSYLTPLHGTFSDEGYGTPRGVSPPRYDHHHHHHHHHMEAVFPDGYDTQFHQPDTYINHYYKDNLDTVKLTTAKKLPPPPNQMNPTDNWKYVNPKYKPHDPRRYERLDHNHDPYQHHSREPRHPVTEAPAFDHMNGDPRNLHQYNRPGPTGLGISDDWRDTAKWNPFLEEHLETGLTKYKQANDIRNTIGKYYQEFNDVDARPRPPEACENDHPCPNTAPVAECPAGTGLDNWKPIGMDDLKGAFEKYYEFNFQSFGGKPRPDDRRDVPEVGRNQRHTPNTAPGGENYSDSDPEDDLYGQDDMIYIHNNHDHPPVPHPDDHHQDPEELEDNPKPDTHHGGKNNHHHKDKLHDPHHHQHHHHHNNDKDHPHHHHHNGDKDHPHHHHHHHHFKNYEEKNRDGKIGEDMYNSPENPDNKDNPTSDTPEQIPLKPRETALRLVEPDSDYQLPTTTDSDEEAATSPTELMSKEEFQLGPWSKKKRSSGLLRTDDAAGVLPNLDTIKGVVLLFGGANPKVPFGPGNGGRSVYMFTRETNKWKRIGYLPQPRTNFGLAKVGNDVYVIGGTDPQDKDKDGRNNPVTTVYRLDLRSGEWDTVKHLDQARSHFGCVALGQHIYIIGGNVDKRASKSCIKYDIAKNTFRTISPLGIERSNMGIAIFGTGIMIAGGATRDPERLILETVTCYDPVKDRWTPWANLPAPRAFTSLVTTRNRVYLVAGAGMKNMKKKGNHSLPDVLYYNEGKDEWEEIGMISSPRHGHTAVALVDNIIIIGGVSSHTMGALDSVEIFSPSTGMTSIMKSISQHKSGMVALAL